MAWITLTEADALTVVNAKLLTAARTKALAEGQEDPLFATLTGVIGFVRGKVGACKNNTLGAGDTIPSKLKRTTLNIFAYEILGRLDLDPEPGSVKEKLYNTAIKTLDAAAACDFDIEEPLTPTEEKSSSSGRPRITPRCHRFSREDGDGS